MLILGSRLVNTPVMSLQTGGRLARAAQPVIDPGTLKIVAYELDGQLLTERPSFLRIEDMRELGSLGMIVDSTDEFVGLHDIIKLEKLYKLQFQPVGMSVIDEKRHKLGKVEDYTVDTQSFVIQQLNVKRGILKGFIDTGLLIHRSQIVEINDHAIIVKSTAKKHSPEPVMEATRTEFVNPFRGANPAPEPETTSTR